MTRFAVAVLLSLLVHLPALAADPAAPADAKAAAAKAPAAPAAPVKVAALDLARLTMPKEIWSRSMTMLSQDAQQRMQSHPGSQLTFPADFPAKVRAEVEKVLPYEDLIAMHGRELSAAYTDKELADLLAFYRSPTGQKFLRVGPEVGSKIEAETQQRFQQRMPAVMQTLSADLKHPAPAKAADKPADKTPVAPAKK
jgi:hypothetical protein